MDHRTRQEKAKDLRYKRAALESMGSAYLLSRLDEIEEACDNVKYYLDQDDDTLLNALDGDEEEEYEFKMMFVDLSADAYRLRETIYNWRFNMDEYDDCTLGLAGLDDRDYDDATVGLMGDDYFFLTGFDSYERDYYHLIGPYEGEWAQRECIKRLQSKTKADLLEVIGRSWRVFLAFFDLDQRYRHMQSTLDILRGDNTVILSAIKQIEQKYKDMMAPWDKVYRQLDRKAAYDFDLLVADLPDRVWIE